MHASEYQRPVALTHTTDLLGSPYEYPVCTRLRSRASYRSPSPITCEFIHRSRLSGPNSIYMVRARALELNRKNENKKSSTFFFFIVTYCPLEEFGQRSFNCQSALWPLGKLLWKTRWQEMFLLFVPTSEIEERKNKRNFTLYYKLVIETCNYRLSILILYSQNHNC